MLRVSSLLLVTSISLFAFGTTSALAASCETCPTGTTCTDKTGGSVTCTAPKEPVCNNQKGHCQNTQDTTTIGPSNNNTCTCTQGPGHKLTCTPTDCNLVQ
jgi:hypothetical protein